MSQGAMIAAAGLLAFGAWWAWRNPASSDPGAAAVEWATDAAETIDKAVEYVADSIMPLMLWKMRDVRAEQLSLQNVAALLRVIRVGEGTADAGGYRRLFGGGTFAGFADHPRQLVVKSGYRSTAAGAYQFLESTWDETARIMGLRDFSPASQDLAALGRIAARGALDDAIAGRLESALRKIAREWASLPGSPYGQPTISLTRARQVFADAGGTTYA